MNNSYWFIRKDIVLKYGIGTGIFLSLLSEADNGDWFPLSIKEVEDEIGLSGFKQERSIEQLVKEGIIEKELRGLPAKRHFRIKGE